MEQFAAHSIILCRAMYITPPTPADDDDDDDEARQKKAFGLVGEITTPRYAHHPNVSECASNQDVRASTQHKQRGSVHLDGN